MMRPEIQETVIQEGFSKLNVWVVGDVMVDEYVTGKVSRISPEAPIPILNYEDVQRIAGGASNVAHNVAKLGSKVTMLGVIGDDPAGEWLKGHLQSCQINTEGLIAEDGRHTTLKRRFGRPGKCHAGESFHGTSAAGDAGKSRGRDRCRDTVRLPKRRTFVPGFCKADNSALQRA